MRSRTRRVVSASRDRRLAPRRAIESSSAAVRARVLTDDRCRAPPRAAAAEGLLRIPRNGHGGRGARGIAFRLTPPSSADEPEWRSARTPPRATRAERLDRVHAARGDVAARVTALRARQLDPQHDVIRRSGLTGRAGAAGACGRFPRSPTVSASSLVPSRLTSSRPDDERRVERLRAVEALLLGDREEELERSVLDRVVVRDGHRRRDADPVVRAERRSVGAHPVVLDATSIRPSRGSNGLSGSRSQTMSRCAWRTTVGAALAPGERGHARRRRFPPSSTRASQPASSRPREDVFARRALLLRRPRDARELEEALPDERRLEPGERSTSPLQRERGPDHEERDPEHARPRERDPLDAEPAVAVDDRGEPELRRDEERPSSRRRRCAGRRS